MGKNETAERLGKALAAAFKEARDAEPTLEFAGVGKVQGSAFLLLPSDIKRVTRESVLAASEAAVSLLRDGANATGQIVWEEARSFEDNERLVQMVTHRADVLSRGLDAHPPCGDPVCRVADVGALVLVACRVMAEIGIPRALCEELANLGTEAMRRAGLKEQERRAVGSA